MGSIVKISRKEANRIWYENNRAHHIAKVLARLKETNYATEKSNKQRELRYIKRRTRWLFPLAGHFCEICSSKATEHHFNTKPIEIGKFNYVCHRCHMEIENGN